MTDAEVLLEGLKRAARRYRIRKNKRAADMLLSFDDGAFVAANIDAIVEMIEQLQQDASASPLLTMGDRWNCLDCGHDCTSAEACQRNAYGHQRATVNDERICLYCWRDDLRASPLR